MRWLHKWLKGAEAMQKELHVRTTVLPGGKVVTASPELEAGQTIDVVARSTNYYIRYYVGREG